MNNPVPHSPELEDALIGSVLIDPGQVESLDVSPADLYIHRNRWILEAVQEMVAEGRAVDLLTLTEYLEDKGKLAEIGGAPHLTDLITQTPTSVHAPEYADQVRKLAARRRMINIANDLAKAAFDTENDIEKGAASALDQLATFKVSQKGAVPIAQHHYTVKGEVIRRSQMDQDAFSLRTGLAPIDRMLGRLYPDDGTMLLLTGEPGLGKTILMQDIGRFYAGQSPGAIYSSEMNAFRLMLRDYAAQDKRLRVSSMKRGEVNLDHLDNMDRIYNQSKLFLSDSSDWTTTSLRADLTRLKREHGIRWYAFDYLSLLMDGVRGEEHDRTRQISLRLMRINRALGLHSLVIHTLTKSGTVAGAAGVAYDADIIAQLKMPRDYVTSDLYKTVEFYVTKNRDGEGPLGKDQLGLLYTQPHFIAPGVDEGEVAPPWYNDN